MNTLIRKTFLFLVARAHRSTAAALATALMALLFARRLMTPAARPNSGGSGRTFDDEYRRIDR